MQNERRKKDVENFDPPLTLHLHSQPGVGNYKECVKKGKDYVLGDNHVNNQSDLVFFFFILPAD